MEVTETLSEGLKREFKVVLPVTELEQRLTSELSTLKDRVRLNGFRPGKVPVEHLRKVYGRSVMADVVQNAVNEVNRKIVDENSLRLAREPDVQFPLGKDEVEKVMDAKGDLAFTVALEVLPTFELADLSSVTLKRQVAQVSDAEIDEALERMATRSRSYSAKEGAAETGDRVVIDFTGRIDGAEFAGGKGEDMPVNLGSGSFIPGFEDQLLGAKAGDARHVLTSFPADYPAAHLAGKAAEFDVTVKEVRAPDELKVDDEMAKGLGLESLEKLRVAVQETIQHDFDAQSRRKVKKELLDALDLRYGFELPPSLVEQEYAGVWSQVEADLKKTGRTFADEGTTEEEARAEYRRISERRVRLGLVLAQIGERTDIKVSEEEVTRAIHQQLRQYPGQEKQVWEFYRKNPQALAEIRAPLFEEKVVDVILGQVAVVDAPVSREVLFADEDTSDPAKGDAEATGAEARKESLERIETGG